MLQASSEGVIRTAEEEDNYLQQRGPLRRFQNQFGCVQDIIRYSVNLSAIPDSLSIIIGKCSYVFHIKLQKFKIGYCKYSYPYPYPYSG